MTNPAGGTGANDQKQMWDRFKEAAQFLGVVGTGSGGFTVLAFGIGYLAAKSHDAMLGLPSTVTSYASYVRTGALFFTRSITDLVTAIATTSEALIGVIGVVAVAVLLGLIPKSRAWLVKVVQEGKSPGAAALGVAYLLVLAAAFAYMPTHVEPLRARNSNLLFADTAKATPLTTALRSQSTETLHRRYGLQLLVVVALVSAGLGLREWRMRLRRLNQPAAGATAGAFWLGLTQVVTRPLLYLAVVLQIATIPMVYGVLAHPSTQCVQPDVAKKPDDAKAEPGAKGLLWSDLTADTTTLVILERVPYGYAQRWYNRNLVRRLVTLRCNILTQTGQ